MKCDFLDDLISVGYFKKNDIDKKKNPSFFYFDLNICILVFVRFTAFF